ncbi:MAG: STAS domain-containing protein [bacterium]|nr:STAS domain-containing protein [bacterium]
MALQVAVEERGEGAFVVAPRGSVDSTTYTVLDERIGRVTASGPRMVILDMRDVDYISSAGVGVIFKARKAVADAGGTLYMAHLRPNVAKVFRIISALPDEQVFESIEELDRYLDRIQRNP